MNQPHRVAAASRGPKVPGRTTAGFAFSILDRALRDSLADRKFALTERYRALAFFADSDAEGPRCAYCGSAEVTRWDHLLAIHKHGDTVFGNMVPACRTCDDSKGHLDFAEWMRSARKGSPTKRGVSSAEIERRIQRLSEYVKSSAYSARTFEERLAPDELSRLRRIEKTLAEVRKEFDALVADYRARVRI